MPKGGNRAGAGRPTNPDKKVRLLVSVDPWLMRLIDRSKGKSSRSAHAEKLLKAAVQKPTGDRQAMALGFLLSQAAVILRTADRKKDADGFDWTKNRTDFEALKSAIEHVLDHFAPAGNFQPDRYSLFSSPEEAGRTISAIIHVYVTTDPEASFAIAERRNSPAGTIRYAFPQAARDLGISTRPKRSKP